MLDMSKLNIILFLTVLILVSVISCEKIVEPLPSVNPHDSQGNNFVPDITSELNIIQNSDKSIDIYWKNNSYNYSKFIIERKDQSHPYMILGEVPKDSTHFRDITGLKIENTYSYRIGTVAANGNIGYSEEQEFKLIFTPPSNIRATDSQRTNVFLQWPDYTSFEKGFIIEKSVGDGEFMEIARTEANITNYLDTNLDTNHTATYRIRAFTDINLSDTSQNIKINFDPELTEYGNPHAIYFTDLDLSEEGNLFVATDALSGGVHLFATETLAHIITITTEYKFPYDIAISPDGSTVAQAVGDKIELWNANTGELIQTLLNECKFVKFSPDGQYLASSSLTDSTTLWDTNSWTNYKKFLGSAPAQFLSDGKLLITFTSDDNNTLIYYSNILSNQEINTIDISQKVNLNSNFSFTEDGKFVLYCAGSNLYLTRTLDLKTIFQSTGSTSIFSPSGRIFAAGNGNIINLWRLNDQKIIWTKSLYDLDHIYKILFNKYETRMIVLYDNGIRQWSIKYKWKQAN